MKKDVVKQIKSITLSMIQNGISIAENFVADRNGLIVWENYKSISYALKKSDYSNIYRQHLLNRSFNFVFLDGGIMQMMYQFKKKKLVSHRLSFYPNPYMQSYQENPEEYENLYYGNTLFSDMINSENIIFPIRFDYNSTDEKFVDQHHPYSHVTISNYSGCRIPVVGPVSPNRFVDFILRNFYFNIFCEKFKDSDFDCNIFFNETISVKEKNKIHFSYRFTNQPAC